MCVCVCQREEETRSHAVPCPKVRKTTETDGRRFILNYSFAPLCFLGILEWYSPLAPSLPQLSQPVTTTIPLRPQGWRESFVPLHHPPLASLSLMVVAADRLVLYIENAFTLFFFLLRPWPIVLRTRQKKKITMFEFFANESLKNCRMSNKHRAIPLVVASVHGDACVLLWFVRGH